MKTICYTFLLADLLSSCANLTESTDSYRSGTKPPAILPISCIKLEAVTATDDPIVMPGEGLHEYLNLAVTNNCSGPVDPLALRYCIEDSGDAHAVASHESLIQFTELRSTSSTFGPSYVETDDRDPNGDLLHCTETSLAGFHLDIGATRPIVIMSEEIAFPAGETSGTTVRAYLPKDALTVAFSQDETHQPFPVALRAVGTDQRFVVRDCNPNFGIAPLLTTQMVEGDNTVTEVIIAPKLGPMSWQRLTFKLDSPTFAISGNDNFFSSGVLANPRLRVTPNIDEPLVMNMACGTADFPNSCLVTFEPPHFDPDFQTLPPDVATTYSFIVELTGFASGDTLTTQLLCRDIGDCEWSDLAQRRIGPEEIPELTGDGLIGQTLTR